ncbi:MAG: alkyl hydroperoxide reductase [Acidobacteria bacterium]|nr:MAG: alkyl hydroperoxide reductase [Acidobacteriota bacterium]
MLAVVLLFALSDGRELIGTAPRDWEVAEWVQGGPLRLEDLRGRAVLVRFWTGPECPYCRAAAPYLRDWHARYSSEGLVVVGLYHRKSAGPVTTRGVAELARGLGFRFPVGIDQDWRTLRRWWFDGGERDYTSVTFLLDQEGVIRAIHPGGAYTRDEAARLEGEIRRLLKAAR